MAEDIGYPVMIKASSGGGGKGMRSCSSPDDFEENFQVAQLESVRGFGDNTMYIEKYVQEPRHIEFQIMADKFGNVVQFGERDCSIQRNHQKMIEESPSVALTPELRRRMGDAAVRAAKAAHYENAGTIEFLLDKDGKFLFYGNEYPNPGGASGYRMGDRCGSYQRADPDCRREPLSCKQEDIQLTGHAIECRINAENPSGKDFRPCPGTITTCTFREERECVLIQLCTVDIRYRHIMILCWQR